MKQEEEWLDRITRTETDVVWGHFQEDEHIGGTGIHGIDWRSRRAVTGTVIGDRSRWGRGIATESMALRTQYAFEELGLENSERMCSKATRRAGGPLKRSDTGRSGSTVATSSATTSGGDVWIGELLREDWPGARRA